MIIECPSCNTKFAVDGQQLAEIENPRFHCSRCGHLFERADKSKAAAAATDALDEPNEPDSEQENIAETAPGSDLPPQTGAFAAKAGSIEEDSDDPFRKQPKSGTQLALLDVDAAPPNDEEPQWPAVHWPAADSASPYEADLRDVRTQLINSPERLELLDDDDHLTEELRQFSKQIVQQSRPGTGVPPTSPDDAPDLADTFNRWQDDIDEIPAEEEISAREIGGEISASFADELEDEQSEGVEDSGSWTLEEESFRSTVEVEDPLAADLQSIDTQDGEAESFSWPDIDRSEVLVDPQIGNSEPEPISTQDALQFAAEDRPAEETPAQRRAARRRAKRAERLLKKFDNGADNRAEVHWPGRKKNRRRHSGAFTRADGRGENTSVQRAVFWTLPLLLIWSFPLILLLAFGVWRNSLDSTPDLIKDVLHLHSLNMQKLPPTGLELLDLRSEFITLDDGNTVLEIHGDVVNATLNPYRDVKLEAKVYAADNKELKKVVVDLKNGLVGAKLPALKEESIEDHQQRRGAGRNELKPNGRSPFRIVLTGLSGEEAYYSARVYSVLDG